MTEKRELPLPDAEEFFVLCIKEPINTTYMVWWKPNNCGYTCDIDKAGRYTRQQILDQPWYYNDGWNTLAIPCEVAEKEAIQMCMFENPLVSMINEARDASGYRAMLKAEREEYERYKQKQLEVIKDERKSEAQLQALQYDEKWSEEDWEKKEWNPDDYEWDGYAWQKTGNWL